MEMDCNLKKLATFLKFILSILEKLETDKYLLKMIATRALELSTNAINHA